MKLVGQIGYHAHPATSVVVGDYDTIQGWTGEDSEEEGPVAVASGTVFVLDVDLLPPDVVVDDAKDIWLTALENNKKYGLAEIATTAQVRTTLEQPYPAAIDDDDSDDDEEPTSAPCSSAAASAVPATSRSALYESGRFMSRSADGSSNARARGRVAS